MRKLRAVQDLSRGCGGEGRLDGRGVGAEQGEEGDQKCVVDMGWPGMGCYGGMMADTWPRLGGSQAATHL